MHNTVLLIALICFARISSAQQKNDYQVKGDVDFANRNYHAAILVLEDYYNLACLYSLMNQPDQANNYLKIAIDRGYAKKYAATDEDLDNIRNTPDYKNTIGDSK